MCVAPRHIVYIIGTLFCKVQFAFDGSFGDLGVCTVIGEERRWRRPTLLRYVKSCVRYACRFCCVLSGCFAPLVP